MLVGLFFLLRLVITYTFRLYDKLYIATSRGDFDEIDDLNDYGALGGPSSASEAWNPDAVAIPVLCYSTKEILDAVDELGVKLNKEANS